MRHPILFGTILLFVPLTASAQESGNSVFRQYRSDQPAVTKLYLTDSTFIVQANVLLNMVADSYGATFGVSEIGATLGEANSKIEKRIQNFITSLAKINIAADDVYVDRTTQTEILDYKVNGSYAEQYVSGFEQKKNVIIKFKTIDELDKIIAFAADYGGIYDLAKVDYYITDTNGVYVLLFETAMGVINSKKELYAKATGVKLKSSSQIYGESFQGFYPPQLYKNYTPDLSASYSDYSSASKRKDLRRNTTYYYDQISYSGFDKVIHPVVTEPVVEFALTLQVKFRIDNSKTAVKKN